jgi:Fic family protein
MYKITIANWRQDVTGPMQVVSGAMGKEKVHFEAPDSPRIEREMNQFLGWFNTSNGPDLVLKAAIAHV